MTLLRSRDFRILLLTSGLSSLGDFLALTALLIRVHDRTESGLAVAALLLAGLVPTLLLAPLAGLVVDRFETRRVLIIVSAVQGGIVTALALVSSLPAILALAFAFGAVASAGNPALLALLPKAVGEERTKQANAYLSVTTTLGGALGPLLGGALVAAVGSRPALLADAGTFLVMAAGIATMRARREPAATAGGVGRLRQAREGVSFLVRDRLLRLVTLVLAGAVLFAAVDNVATVFFAKDVLGAGDLGFGVLLTLWPLGMAAGAAAVGRWVRMSALGLTVLVASIGGGAAVALAAALPGLALAAAAYFLGGVANGADVVAIRSLIHHRTPEGLQGRTFAAWAALVTAAQLGATGLGGLLVALLGGRGTLLLGGLGATAVGAVGLALYARLGADDVAVPTPDGPS